jgi:hypothetical protein
MSKVGRNQSCPCGSGKKYKHCCLPLQKEGRIPSPMAQLRVSLLAEIKKVQEDAKAGTCGLRELGVFIFFSQENGDAWVLEASDSDAVQVAANGEPLQAPVEENPETIEVNWSHTFAIKEHKIFLTSYEDKQETELAGAPTQQISAAMKRILNRYSQALLDRVHVSTDMPEDGV